MQRFLCRRNIYTFAAKVRQETEAPKPKVESEISTVEGHRPPSFEDTVQGKYAGVLFTTASQASSLHKVLEDMQFFKDLSIQSEAFRNFIQNIQFSSEDQLAVFQTLSKDQFNSLTWNFLNTLVENKRVEFLPKIAQKYIDYYRILNKEENITIISAQQLNTQERSQVVNALKLQNPGVQFIVQYQVDPSILGGLQMYSGNKFLDCSLLSRVQKLRSELQRISI